MIRTYRVKGVSETADAKIAKHSHPESIRLESSGLMSSNAGREKIVLRRKTARMIAQKSHPVQPILRSIPMKGRKPSVSKDYQKYEHDLTNSMMLPSEHREGDMREPIKLTDRNEIEGAVTKSPNQPTHRNG